MSFVLLGGHGKDAARRRKLTSPCDQNTVFRMLGNSSIPMDEGSIVHLLTRLLEYAVMRHASDIHLEPKADELAVRLRIDGILQRQRSFPAEVAPAVASRIKVLARMDIAEKRIPQDGTFAMEVQGKVINLRCSSFPCQHGEKVVLRILSEDIILTDLGSLGVSSGQLLLLKQAIRASHGLILSTGPTGAGKTSTLHSLIKRLDYDSLNITTLEDPIEVRSERLTQAQIHPRIDFTFASGLRHVLRQDPDVILVGEMRDTETAQIAFQASLTGHLVLSTLHTTSCVDTITRLLDMGLEPYLVASSLSVIIAQRLVRLLCPLCREPYKPDKNLAQSMGFNLPGHSGLIYQPKGCLDCNHSGYRGRTGLFEVLDVDDAIRTLIKQKSASHMYKQVLAERKVPTLRRDGIRKVLEGLTSIQEVMRVT